MRAPSPRRVVQTLGVSELQLVGREALLDRVLGELADRRAVVMSGAAGVGKSRLAAEAAARAELRGWTSNRVVATRAAASIPFGAMVSLLPDDAGTQTPLALLAALRQRLQDGPDGQPQLLVIDDLPRLDVPSAALVHQVVTERLCAVLGTVRTGEAAPDAVEALLDGDDAVRIDVPSLTAQEVGVLIEAALGGQCDANLTQVLMQLSSGNPLYVRELVRDGVAAGWLAQTGNVWRIAGVPRGTGPADRRRRRPAGGAGRPGPGGDGGAGDRRTPRRPALRLARRGRCAGAAGDRRSGRDRAERGSG